MELNKLNAEVSEAELLSMPLHTFYVMDKNLCIYRVPGGWVYQVAGEYPQAVYVPETLMVPKSVAV